MMSSDHPSSPHSVGVLAASPEPNQPLSSSADDQLFEKSTLTARRWMTAMAFLSALGILAALLCLQFGAQYVGLSEILRIVVQMAWGTHDQVVDSDATATILLHVRLPRVFLGFLVGCSLASVGVALQALLRNPLAIRTSSACRVVRHLECQSPCCLGSARPCSRCLPYRSVV